MDFELMELALRNLQFLDRPPETCGRALLALMEGDGPCAKPTGERNTIVNTLTIRSETEDQNTDLERVIDVIRKEGSNHR